MAPDRDRLIHALEPQKRTPAPIGALDRGERAAHGSQPLKIVERAVVIAREPARKTEIPARIIAKRGAAVALERLLERRDRLFVTRAIEIEPADQKRGL